MPSNTILLLVDSRKNSRRPLDQPPPPPPSAELKKVCPSQPAFPSLSASPVLTAHSALPKIKALLTSPPDVSQSHSLAETRALLTRQHHSAQPWYNITPHARLTGLAGWLAMVMATSKEREPSQETAAHQEHACMHHLPHLPPQIRK